MLGRGAVPIDCAVGHPCKRMSTEESLETKVCEKQRQTPQVNFRYYQIGHWSKQEEKNKYRFCSKTIHLSYIKCKLYLSLTVYRNCYYELDT